jgi:hypothetical protein
MGTQGYKLAHPGYAWTFRRDFWDHCGLLDGCIAGASDHHMAMGLIGRAEYSIKKGVHPNYAANVLRWQERALRFGKRLTYTPTVIEHPYHGSKKSRRYIERWSILTENDYDPMKDVRYNTQGVLELAGNKPKLANDLYRYMVQRNEDANTLPD